MKKTAIMITIAILALISVLIVAATAAKRREGDDNSSKSSFVNVSEEMEGLSEAAETVKADEGLAEPETIETGKIDSGAGEETESGEPAGLSRIRHTAISGRRRGTPI